MNLIQYISEQMNRVSVDAGIDSIRESLFETVVKVFCIVGFFAVAMGGLELRLQGKEAVTLVYIAAYLPVPACLIFRKSLPYKYRTAMILVPLYILAVLVLGGFGLDGAGIILLVTFCVLAAVFQGARMGMAAIAMSVAAILTVGWGMSARIIPVDVAAVTNSTRIEAWLTAGVLFLLVGGGMVACITVLQDSLQKTIGRLQEKKGQLQSSNRELEKAVNTYRETQKELKESEAFHRRLFEDSPVALYIQDFSSVEAYTRALGQEGVSDMKTYLGTHTAELERFVRSVKILRFNRAAVEMYKAGSRTNLLSGLGSLIKLKDSQHFIDQVAAFTSGEDLYEGEARNLDFHGNTLDVILRKTVMDREKNGLSRILVSVVDVTALYQADRERRELERQLQQTRKMETIGTLAGGIAHDFNNILFPISGNTELLLAELPEGSPLRSRLRKIRAGAARAAKLVRQILAFSRQEPGELRPVRIQEILEEVVSLLQSTIPATIEIQQNIDRGCGPVNSDPTQIHQIIMNLCTNAYHAMEEGGGVLRIGLREAGPPDAGSDLTMDRYACLTVRDTGTGIPSDLVDKIFDPFFTTKEMGRGTGMGLSVVHGIVSKMGGAIRVKSSKDDGTGFYVYFPLDPGIAQMPEMLSQVSMTSGDEHILLVDDEQEVIDMEANMLERLGYRVSTSTSSGGALALFKSDPSAYDLVISDVAMPGMDGRTLSTKMLDVRPDIPILLCTGYSRALNKEKAEAIGAKGLMIKPVVMGDLARAIRAALDPS